MGPVTDTRLVTNAGGLGRWRKGLKRRPASREPQDSEGRSERLAITDEHGSHDD
jgi:hypothetical protein